MVRCRSSTEQSGQVHPRGGHELRPAVRSYVERYAKTSDPVCQKQARARCRVCGGERNGLQPARKPVDDGEEVHESV